MTVEQSNRERARSEAGDRGPRPGPALAGTGAALPAAQGTSPFRVVFIIVPLLIIALGGIYLAGAWIAGYQEGAREERPGSAERSSQGDDAQNPPRDVSASGGLETSEENPDAFDPATVRALLAEADLKQGAVAFKICSVCHSVEKGGPAKIGPNLWNIVGSPVASRVGFTYSPALRSTGGTWSYERLADYLHNPRTFAPGTSMAFRGILENRRMADLIAYLRTLSDNPAPLPN